MIGVVGEIFSWTGLMLGLPLLVVVLVVRLVEGEVAATEAVVVSGPDAVLARWFAAGDFDERPLRDWELHRLRGRDSFDAFVSRRNPSRMRLDAHRPLVPPLRTAGTVLTIVGACGFVASWLPAFFG